MATRDVNVDVGYDAGKTNVEVNASKDEQTIKVSQQIDDDNRVAPSFALRSGKMAVEWERNLGDDNSLTTTLRPNEEIEMEWKVRAGGAKRRLLISTLVQYLTHFHSSLHSSLFSSLRSPPPGFCLDRQHQHAH